MHVRTTLAPDAWYAAQQRHVITIRCGLNSPLVNRMTHGCRAESVVYASFAECAITLLYAAQICVLVSDPADLLQSRARSHWLATVVTV